MAAPHTIISVAEYLDTVYEPDLDYVDGDLEDRNAGEFDHADLQTEIAVYFRNQRIRCGCHSVVETRVQTSATRFRIPDVSLIRGKKPAGRVVQDPPFVCIEILSPEDRMSRMQRRIDEYIQFGVQSVWVIDHETRRGYVYTAEGMTEPKDQVLFTNDANIRLPLPEIFASLDEANEL